MVENKLRESSLPTVLIDGISEYIVQMIINERSPKYIAQQIEMVIGLEASVDFCEWLWNQILITLPTTSEKQDYKTVVAESEKAQMKKGVIDIIHTKYMRTLQESTNVKIENDIISESDHLKYIPKPGSVFWVKADTSRTE
ncbi:hypothetical protein AKO1_014277 [Acrasis kona]|uniref:PWI domain-containing protein n=1 Tax=Acrasis kona TaxID=1008807 RepID=A0AAW2Z2C4_9EUKA